MPAVRTILCFGDSNTYGYIPGSGGRYEAGQRWPRRLGMLLGEGHEVLEEGLNGPNRTPSGLISILACL